MNRQVHGKVEITAVLSQSYAIPYRTPLPEKAEVSRSSFKPRRACECPWSFQEVKWMHGMDRTIRASVRYRW